MVEIIKTFRFGEKGETVDRHSIDTANALVLLSQSERDLSMNRHHKRKRVFECSTCSKQFTSFQALGGHRASHKKPRLPDGDQDRTQSTAAVSKPKVHECSICGLEFAIGQALGGHMRRHRASSSLVQDKSSHGSSGGLCLDLNLAPSGGHNLNGPELELGLSLGLGYV